MHILNSKTSALIKKYHKKSADIAIAAILFWIIETTVFLLMYGWHWEPIGVEKYFDGIVLILLIISLCFYIKTLWRTK